MEKALIAVFVGLVLIAVIFPLADNFEGKFTGIATGLAKSGGFTVIVIDEEE